MRLFRLAKLLRRTQSSLTGLFGKDYLWVFDPARFAKAANRAGLFSVVPLGLRESSLALAYRPKARPLQLHRRPKGRQIQPHRRAEARLYVARALRSLAALKARPLQDTAPNRLEPVPLCRAEARVHKTQDGRSMLRCYKEKLCELTLGGRAIRISPLI